MGLGISIIVGAAGACLTFAVRAGTGGAGAGLQAVGVTLLALGAVGSALSLVFWSSWGGAGIGRPRHIRVVGLCTIEEC